MKFRYTAVDKLGKTNSDTLEANDTLDATEKLRKQGLFVTDIHPEETRLDYAHHHHHGHKRVGAGRRLKSIAMFTRQLQVLVSTGTPLVQALSALERQAKDDRWRSVVVGLRTKVEEGATLSAAMADHPNYFDSVSRSLVAAGESSGNFESMLDRLASLARKQLHVRSSIVGAMVYPCLLIVVSIAVLSVMLCFVLPRFAELFKTLDSGLPPTTQFLMVLSNILRNYWYAVIGSIVGTVFGLRLWAKSPRGKVALDTIILRLPQFGKITRSFCTARVTRLLGVLIESKVPLIDAIQLTRGATTNHHYTQLLNAAEQSVTRGEPISTAFSNPKLIDPSVCEAIKNGERSGQVGALLLNMSDFLDEDNETIIKSLTSIIEPVILIILGVLVGFVALSMFLPLFDLTSATSGGG